MEDINKAQQRLVNAIVAMHPQLCMGDKKQEELYLAMHDLTGKMAKLNACDGECDHEAKATLPINSVVFSEAELKAKLDEQKEEHRQWLEGEGYELLAERL